MSGNCSMYDLRNTIADVSRINPEGKETVILAKSGYEDRAGKACEAEQSGTYKMDVLCELRAAEIEGESTTVRYAHDDVMADICERLKSAGHE